MKNSPFTVHRSPFIVYMKIAILSPFYPYRGGIAQFSAMLYRVLEKEHEVKVFSFSRLYPEFLFPGKTQYVTDQNPTDFLPSLRILDSINPLSYRKTVKAIEKFHPDILIIAYWTSFLGPAYGHIAQRLKTKTKIISLLHNAVPHEPRFFDKTFAQLLFNRSYAFMVMSETVKNDLLALKPDAHYGLMPHPLYDHFGKKINRKEALQSLDLNVEKKTLLFFGLIRDYKGLDLLIEALSLLDESYQLVIAGESYGSFDKYQKQIDSSPAKNRIKVLNQYIENKTVPLLFSAADLLVLPYKSATQSGVIPVAYHFDTPIVATEVGDLKATIGDTGTGIACTASARSLADGIQMIFTIGKERFIDRIQEEKKRLSWDNFAKTLLEL
jgi:glycosyltransferase involved in cell wall biosynthesis